ncbi:MAG: putative toxin-antitoxin system toxin component, PIN family [Deltaproteobacteria bacterium]|nr:putative toxin-antitoxin system toxin component, PIN family [Deltaproteobacteria bacterium]
MKIVCDTNVLISAYIFPGGSPEEIINLARVKEVTLCISPDIVTEFKKVLLMKFKHTEREADDRVERLTQISEIVYPKERISLIQRKDSDNRILECAQAAEVDYLISGDKRDILPLGKIGQTEILTAIVFLERYKERNTR